MKQRDFTKCLGCGKGVAHAGHIAFYRIKLEHMIINPRAVQRQHGLEMMIGALAAHMGPDEDLAQAVGTPINGLVCQSCALGIGGEPLLAALLSRVEENKEQDDEGDAA
jgi:hypothetical protein